MRAEHDEACSDFRSIKKLSKNKAVKQKRTNLQLPEVERARRHLLKPRRSLYP